MDRSRAGEPRTVAAVVNRRLRLPLEQRLCCTAREASDLLGIGYQKVLDLARRRRLPHALLGKRVVFRKDALLRWLEAEFERSMLEDRTEPNFDMVGGEARS